MKKIATLFLIMLLYACSSEEEVEKQLCFELSTQTLMFDWEGEELDVAVKTNTEWCVESSLPSWLSIVNRTQENMTFCALRNDTGNPRSTLVVFKIGQTEYKLIVGQKAKEKLAFRGEKDLSIPPEGSNLSIGIEQNVSYGVTFLDAGDDWMSLTTKLDNWFSTEASGKTVTLIGCLLSIKVEENTSKNLRKARIVISNESCCLYDTLLISQEASVGRYADGEYKVLQSSSVGAANIIVMGDGFIKKDLTVGGLYESVVSQAIDYFFSIEPYKSYRNNFNVYMVTAESENEGVGQKNSSGTSAFSNKFGTAFGTGTEIVCNDDLVLEYARKVKGLPADKPLTVIVVLNSTKYAGTTYLYSNGNSIALCPMSNEASPNDFEGLIHHEAGGHGFGFLCDEYVYYQKTMPESRKQDLKEWQKLGYQMNLDFTDDTSAILWKDFIGMEKYSKVGAYEGGYEYQYGVWRSEENSCMNNNIPYFNVQSRWSIVRRIMKLSGKEFSISDFIKNDNFIYPENAETRSAKEFIPLGNPVWIMAN